MELKYISFTSVVLHLMPSFAFHLMSWAGYGILLCVLVTTVVSFTCLSSHCKFSFSVSDQKYQCRHECSNHQGWKEMKHALLAKLERYSHSICVYG